MKNIFKSALFAALALVLWAGSVRAALQPGQAAPDFSFIDLQGQSHRLSEYRGKTVVLEWVNPECPFVRKHYESGNMPATQRAAIADGVVWISINSGAAGEQGAYDISQTQAWLKKVNAAPTEYIRDGNGKIGRLYAAKTTPHLFIITKDGTLVYEGAIDSIRSADRADIARATNYVNAALAAIKSGRPVEKSATQPYGCSVKY